MPTVTHKGNPVSLQGPTLEVGQKAPDFKVQLQNLSDCTLATHAGKTVIYLAVPSLDTAVCDTETRRFNVEATKMPGVIVMAVSMDLPFSQKRWCAAAGVENVHTASDHRDASFGKAYGVLISGGPLDRCLARAVFVVGPDGKLRHVEYVPEIGQEPDYATALRAAGH